MLLSCGLIGQVWNITHKDQVVKLIFEEHLHYLDLYYPRGLVILFVTICALDHTIVV